LSRQGKTGSGGSVAKPTRSTHLKHWPRIVLEPPIAVAHRREIFR
jgi:hypothetical protein